MNVLRIRFIPLQVQGEKDVFWKIQYTAHNTEHTSPGKNPNLDGARRQISNPK